MNATDSQLIGRLAAECEAIDRYRELEDWFSDHSHAELAALCARLAIWHRDAYARMSGADRAIAIEKLRAAAVPWMSRDARAREFFYRVASERQLLEVALDAESSEECAAELRSAIGKMGPVDWNAAIESGAGPGLALGMERRSAMPRLP